METVQWINENVPDVVKLVLMALGALVVVGHTYVLYTPTQEDDKWWAKLEENKAIGWALKFLRSFSPIQRKPKK